MLLSKFRKIQRNDPWITEAVGLSGHTDDGRNFAERVRESVSFIAFRPFEEADPNWKGQSEFHPFFHTSQMAGSDGAYCASSPMVVLHDEDDHRYEFIQLLPLCKATIGDSMKWHLQEAKQRGVKIVFDAVVKPLVVKINPHRCFTECYDIYRFPTGFKDHEFDQWIMQKARAKAFNPKNR